MALKTKNSTGVNVPQYLPHDDATTIRLCNNACTTLKTGVGQKEGAKGVSAWHARERVQRASQHGVPRRIFEFKIGKLGGSIVAGNAYALC